MDNQTVTIVALGVAIVAAYFFGRLVERARHAQQKKEIRRDAVARSRAVLGGQFSEQLAPILPGFPFKPTEVRFVGKPVDFIVFRGLDDKVVEEVVFVEVKSGRSRLSTVERSLRDAVQARRVSWHEYRVPLEVTEACES